MQSHLTAVILLGDIPALTVFLDSSPITILRVFSIVTINYKGLFSLRSINLVIKLLAEKIDFKHLY